MEISKYQKKIRESWEETESGKIALIIFDLSFDCKCGHHSRTVDGIKIESSDDGLVLYIWKNVEYKANRFWYKIIPNCGYSIEQLVKCLEAQPWNYL